MSLTTISHTAWLVMLCQLVLKKQERWRSLIEDDDAAFYRHCFDYCRRASLAHRLTSLIPDGIHLWLIEQALAYGASQHYALRKQVIRKQVKTCIDGGVAQLVVLGGGFDPLALHTARRHPAMRCFEIDMPAMHAHKKNAIVACYGNLPGNFFAIAADLSAQTLADVLSAHADFDPGQPTLFIVEGLTMYLRDQAVIDLLADMRRTGGASAHLIFTAMERINQSPSGWGNALRRFSLYASGERYFWTMPHDGMEHFLRGQGFAQHYLLPYAELQRPWRPAAEMGTVERQDGEYLVYAIANPGG